MKAALKWLTPLVVTLCLGMAYTSPTFSAPNDTAQQSGDKPDCKKTPDDPRCKK